MATKVWQTVKQGQCPTTRREAELVEERIYPHESFSDTGPAYQVLAKHCSNGIECNLMGVPCRWAGTNPFNDPFEE